MSKLIILSLATMRLTYLIRYESGPFDMFIRFRELIGISNKETLMANGIISSEQTVEDSFLPKMVHCTLCLSGWMALGLLFLPKKLQLWLAAWGLFYLIETFLFEDR